MTTTNTRQCSNCRHWFANKPVTDPRVSQLYSRQRSDCEHPRMTQMLACISMAHTDRPDQYPLPSMYRTDARFGCILFQRK